MFPDLKTVSTAPGVYLMKSAKGDVLYVGKAKNLRNRLQNYKSGQDDRSNIIHLLPQVESVEIRITENERQALLLEAELIKSLKPKYNIRLKDDKAKIIIRIDWSHDYPRVEPVRFAQNDGAEYIGPFPYSYEIRTLLEVIKRAIPLRTCSDRMLQNRVRPCLEYQIKRCAAPCCFDIDIVTYKSWIKEAIQILKGKNKELVEKLNRDMEKASEELRYEDAAVLRDRLSVLERVIRDRTELKVNFSERTDILGVYRDGTSAEIVINKAREGQTIHNESFSLTEIFFSTGEMLSGALLNYYEQEEDIPQQICLPVELEDQEGLAELLSQRAARKVTISVPKIGIKKRLVELARKNAAQAYLLKSQSKDPSQALVALQHELSLEQTPRTIECIDVSHFQGSQTVSSVVHFKDGLPLKERYRTLNLSQEGKPDDFASIRETLVRHISRGLEENTLVDLIVVDGGKAQLNMALEARAEAGSSLPEIISLAKKRSRNDQKKPERVYMPENSEPIVLTPGSAALNLLEQLRDEAHRFAITTHRKRRAKAGFNSKLSAIPGIGKHRRLKLLREFGSIDKIRKLTATEIAERVGMPVSLAENLLKSINNK